MTDKQNFEKDIDVPSKLLDSNLTRADLCILINDLHIERIGKNKQLKRKEKECSKYKKAIKEIIQQGVKIHDDIIVSKQILQKISECEGNDDYLSEHWLFNNRSNE